MKYIHIVLIFLSWGLLVGCAPTPSQSTTTILKTKTTTITETASPTPVDPPAASITSGAAATLPATEAPHPPVSPTQAALATPGHTLPAPPSTTPLPVETPTPEPTVPLPTTVALAVSAGGETSAVQLQRGFEVYKQLYCGLCHKLDAAATAGTFGPPHNGMATTAAMRIQEPQYRGQATTAAEYIHESIVDPKVFIVPGYAQTQHQMPVYNFLSEADVEALVQMLLQQK